MLATVLALLLLPGLPFSQQYARPRPRAAHPYNPVHFWPKPSTNLNIRPACHGPRGCGLQVLRTAPFVNRWFPFAGIRP